MTDTNLRTDRSEVSGALSAWAGAPVRCLSHIAYRIGDRRHLWQPHLHAVPSADGLISENDVLIARWQVLRAEESGAGADVDALLVRASIEVKASAAVAAAGEGDSGALRLDRVLVARFDMSDIASPRVRVFRNGYQSWSPAHAHRGDDVQKYPRWESYALMNHNVDSPYWGRSDGLLSHQFAVISGRDGDRLGVGSGDSEAAGLGFITQNAGLGEIFIQTRGVGGVEAMLDYGGKCLRPGERLSLEPLWLARGLAPTILEQFAERCGRAMGARVSRDRSPVGWCSWYEFYTEVRDEDVRSNIAVLREHPQLGLSVVQLDDGYQAAVGDWERINDKFPRGLAPLAADIRGTGLSAGLWSAPFFVAQTSRRFREQSQWLLRDENQKPVDCGRNLMWKSRLYALDLSRDEVDAWLRGLFSDWAAAGFDYFKIDFLFAGLRHGMHANPAMSPVEVYRAALATIRDAIGPGRFLLGCGAPLGPSVGYVDGMRISCDVKEVWHSRFWSFAGRGCGIPSLRDSLQNNLSRAFMHRRLWHNDPDCILVRQERSELTVAEVKLMLTVLGMTGGMLLLSDDLSRLAKHRLDWAERILPPTTLVGRAPTAWEEEFPTRFELHGASRRLTAYINWNESPVRAWPDSDNDADSDSGPGITEVTRFDVWGEQVLEEPAVEIDAHGVCAVLETPRSSEPHLVGTNLHLTALVDGRVRESFDRAAGILRIQARDIARSSGQIWLRLPPGFHLGRGADAADEHRELVTSIRPVGPNVWVIGVQAQAPWELQLAIEQRDGPSDHQSADPSAD